MRALIGRRASSETFLRTHVQSVSTNVFLHNRIPREIFGLSWQELKALGDEKNKAQARQQVILTKPGAVTSQRSKTKYGEDVGKREPKYQARPRTKEESKYHRALLGTLTKGSSSTKSHCFPQTSFKGMLIYVQTWTTWRRWSSEWGRHSAPTPRPCARRPRTPSASCADEESSGDSSSPCTLKLERELLPAPCFNVVF